MDYGREADETSVIGRSSGAEHDAQDVAPGALGIRLSPGLAAGRQDLPPPTPRPQHRFLSIGIEKDRAVFVGPEDPRAGRTVAIDDCRRGMAERIAAAGTEDDGGGMRGFDQSRRTAAGAPVMRCL